MDGASLNDLDLIKDLDLHNRDLEAVYLNENAVKVSSSPRAAQVRKEGINLLEALKKSLNAPQKELTRKVDSSGVNNTIESQGSFEEEDSDEENQKKSREQGGHSEDRLDTPRPSMGTLET